MSDPMPAFSAIPPERRPYIARVLADLLPMYARDDGGLSDEERDAWLEMREARTRLLSGLPTNDPAHLRAKLRLLCQRLRHDLPDHGPEVTTYMLAKSARADLEAMDFDKP